jgi:hypothetical protein
MLTAYSLLGQPKEGKKVSPPLVNEKIVELAEKYGVGAGQVSLDAHTPLISTQS